MVLVCGCGSVPQWKAELDRIEYTCKDETMPLGTNPFDGTDPFYQWDYDRCMEIRYALFVQEGRIESLPPQYRDYMHAWYEDWRAQAQRWYAQSVQIDNASSSSPDLAETERMRYLLQLQRERERRRQLRLLSDHF